MRLRCGTKLNLHLKMERCALWLSLTGGQYSAMLHHSTRVYTKNCYLKSAHECEAKWSDWEETRKWWSWESDLGCKWCLWTWAQDRRSSLLRSKGSWRGSGDTLFTPVGGWRTMTATDKPPHVLPIPSLSLSVLLAPSIPPSPSLQLENQSHLFAQWNKLNTLESN